MKSMLIRRAVCTLLLALLTGACGVSRAPVVVEAPPPEPEPPAVPPFPYALAWTARAEVPVRTDAGEARVRNVFTRLNVVAVDTPGLRVHCLYCIPALEGWVDREDVVYEPLPPREAARRRLAEFALAVRAAAERRDRAALTAVMSPDFTFSFGGGGGPHDAFTRWEWEGFRSFDNLVPLLDRGLVTRDSVVWSAPPAFGADTEYHGLRTGFRRTADGAWQWIFLVRGD
jgi:hypothetical protein